ncbi:MAG TPA: hypothetical protein VGO07_06445, partial [Candidatus Saccharimonadales bacterium]|nr:hypothetical protein [Candidatus Saccharimonadales bacterium]
NIAGFAIGSINTAANAEFHPSDVVTALRNNYLLARDGRPSENGSQPQLRLMGMLAGSVSYTFSQRSTRPDVMLFEDTNATEPY